MPSLIGSLFVSLTADFGTFNRNMAASEGRVAQSAQGMRRSIGLTARSVNSFQRQMSTPIRPYALISASRSFDSLAARSNLLRGSLLATTAVFGGFGAAIASNVFTRYLDSFTNLSNQIRVVSDGAADLRAQISAVGDVSKTARASLSATATLYSRLAKASPAESPEKLLRRVETVTKALQLGGATAQESASAAIQFSQAIASNRLGGEELRAVLETPLGGALAKGLGVTIGKLREMSKEGKLTADVLYGALDRISSEVDQKFLNSVLSIDQALTIADSSITKYSGSLDKSYGITRAVSGSIVDLTNNLDTLVPTVVGLAGAFASIYSGRRLSSIGSRAVNPIKAEIKARRESLTVAREQFALAQRAAQTAQEKYNAPKPDPISVAPKSDVKAYRRDLAALQKEDERYLSLQQRRGRVIEEVGRISKSVTIGELRAAQKLADQQLKVNDLKSKERDAAREVQRAANSVTGAAALQSQTSAKLTGPREAQKALNAAKKEQLNISKQIGREEERLQVIQTRLTKERGASSAATSRIVADGLVREKQLTNELIKSSEERIRLENRTRGSRGIAEFSGRKAIKEGSIAAGQEMQRTALGVERAGYAMASATKAASGFRVGLGLLRNAGMSLIGFLGGPWGVAFTTAIGAMALFGARAREEAEKVRNAQQLISAALIEMGEAPQATPNQQKSLLEKRIEEQREIVETVRDEFNRVRQEIEDAVRGRAVDPSVLASPNESAIIKQINAIADAFRDQKLTIQDAKSQLEDLGVRSESLDALIKKFEESKSGIDGANQALNFYIKQLGDLENKKIKVSIEMSLAGQLASYGEGKQSIDKAIADLSRQAQYEQYGAAQRSAQELTRQQRMRQAALEAASDTGDKARNTPAKIAAKEQELLEQGYANTRAEARAFAEELLNLEESQRLANKSADAGAKEYKKFADTIAELRETARGAFLSDLDREVLSIADNLKNGSAMMAQYIDAINSGDMSGAPAQLLEVRDALMQIGAADTWRDIINQYGTAAQLTGRFADKQAELNFLVGTGKITAEQAGLAWADFIGQFAEYGWIDDLSSAFSSFAESAIMDFDNIGDAAANLLKQIAKIILQYTLLQPLENALRGGLGNLIGGGANGNGGGFSPNISFGDLIGAVAKPAASALKNAASSSFASAGMTKGGVPLSVVETAGGLSAKVATQYADRFEGLFKDLDAAGYKITSLGEGGYSYRNVAGTSNLSKHAFGEAVDINPAANPWSKNFKTDLPANVNDIAKQNGLTWGGTWNKPDTMHFQVDKNVKSLDALNSVTSKTQASVDRMNTSAVNATEGIGKFGNGLSNILNRIGTGPNGAGGIVGGLLKNIFGQTLSATASSAVLAGAGGLYHAGGTAGSATTFKMADFSNARRFHTGLKGLRSNELTAVLERGEEVLSLAKSRRTTETMMGLANSVAGNRSNRAGAIHVNVEGANGDQHVMDLVQQGVVLGLREYDKTFSQKAIASVAQGKQRGQLR